MDNPGTLSALLTTLLKVPYSFPIILLIIFKSHYLEAPLDIHYVYLCFRLSTEHIAPPVDARDEAVRRYGLAPQSDIVKEAL